MAVRCYIQHRRPRRPVAASQRHDDTRAEQETHDQDWRDDLPHRYDVIYLFECTVD